MLTLRMASEADFELLRVFRNDIFSSELGIQLSHYQDIFNDYLSKNVLLYAGEMLCGVVRLAFSREAQSFYISYLAVRPSSRNQVRVSMLLGAVLHLMRENGIEVVRGDSADENLPMYLGIGCRISGPKLKKYGFNCEWTPIEYLLGTNGAYEDRLVNKAREFMPADLCRWRFEPQILLCGDQIEYQSCLDALIANGKLFKVIPHLGPEGGATLDAIHSNTIPRVSMMRPEASLSALMSESPGGDTFLDYNESFDKRHVIFVRRGSLEALLAKCYAMLTRKHVVFIDSWESFSVPGEHPATALVFVSPGEFVENWWRLAGALDGVAWGIAAANSPEAFSQWLLRSYFLFTGPAMGRDCIVFAQDGDINGSIAVLEDGEEQGVKTSTRLAVVLPAEREDAKELSWGIRQERATRVLFLHAAGQWLSNGFAHLLSQIEGRVSHAVMGKGGSVADSKEDGILFFGLMRRGFSLGEALQVLQRRHERTLSHPSYLLVGDPRLRLLPREAADRVDVCFQQGRLRLVLRGPEGRNLLYVEIHEPHIVDLLRRGAQLYVSEPGVHCRREVEGDAVRLLVFRAHPLPSRVELVVEGEVQVGHAHP